jgi:hypothetical protein
MNLPSIKKTGVRPLPNSCKKTACNLRLTVFLGRSPIYREAAAVVKPSRSRCFSVARLGWVARLTVTMIVGIAIITCRLPYNDLITACRAALPW